MSACVCVRPLLSPSLSFCVCTSGAQGLLSIGSVWLNVKNCGFLPGASLSGSLPCLHFLNTPLFLNLLQVFGQDVKTHTGPGEQDFSPPPHPLLSLPSLTSNLCPPGLDFFFSPLLTLKSRDFCLLWDNLYVMCFLFGHFIII